MKLLRISISKLRNRMISDIFLDKDWLTEHHRKIKGKAGPRYSPELNIDLPIAEIFDGISRNKDFYVSIRSNFGNLIRAFGHITSKYENDEIYSIYQNTKMEFEVLINLLQQTTEYNTQLIPWKDIGKAANQTLEISWQLVDKLREEKNKQEKNNTECKYRDLGSDIHFIYETQKGLRYFEELSTSAKAQLSNNPFLLLTGIAGSGKTHLLCDVVKNRVITDNPTPVVLVFGEHFESNTDVFKQIVNQADLEIAFQRFLRLLDSAGKKRKCRALLIIDALNETTDRVFWKNNLDKVISEVKKYPNIALVASLRSGFEKDVLTEDNEKFFVKEDHPGFQFREWEAVSKFFLEFGLPLPEIPLLLPEFQNPLFLLLFCKAFEKKAKGIGSGNNKQIFRGHEGATFIFESFVDQVSSKLTQKFRIDTSKQNDVWNRVIKKIAEEMVNSNNERVSENQLESIVKNAYPDVDVQSFIQELERNLLLVKVPKYSVQKQGYEGFEFRFPFQKFSDHLIGRYLFKKYEEEFGKSNKNLQTAMKYFSRRRKLGKYLFDSWNRGIIEALSIQCPEHLKGIEFIEVAPYLRNSSIATEAFIESLIWRKPGAYTRDIKNTLDYINSVVLRTQSGLDSFLNALLSVAPIPNHPLNADFLNKYLSKFSIAVRDSWWSTFLHYQNNERSAVDRLIEWSWSSQDKSHLTDESVRLCSVALAWFFTTSNRFVRDKSTKALVSLLMERLSVMLDILKVFRDVNDPYVSERVYAVAYGVALRSRQDTTGLKSLAFWIYKNVFKEGGPPTHILLRDYARGVIQVALDSGVNLNVSKKKFTPPFGSKWPKRVPTEKTLRKKYYPEAFFQEKTKDRGFLDIWSSVMYNFGTLGDFGDYVLNTSVNHWSGRKLQGTDINRHLVLEDFKMKLTPTQQTLFEKATNPYFGIDFSEISTSIETIRANESHEGENPNRPESDEDTGTLVELQEFELSISPAKRKYFKEEIQPFLNGRRGMNDPLDQFDTGLAQRWVFNKVVKLGWKHELHGRFDELVNHNRGDRSAHKPERIGKKYQWIALHELLARIADNFEFKDPTWLYEASQFEGTWQIGIRDIDPSCILRDFAGTTPEDIPTFNDYNNQGLYNAWGEKISDVSWLKKTNDLPDPKEIVEITDITGDQWLALESFVEWEDETPPEIKKYDIPTRRLWYMIKSYLVKDRDKEKVFKWASKQNYMGRWMPESHEFYEVFLAEYPWSPAFLYQYTPYFNHDEWTDSARWKEKIPSKVLVTDDEYDSGGSSFDCSTEESIKVKLPAKFIVDKMGLYQHYVDGGFYDTNGELIAFDPSVFSVDHPRQIFIRKDRLISLLETEGYSIIWTVLGEKNLIGGGVMGQPLGWLEINGSYTLLDKTITGTIKATFNKPKN